MIQESRVQDQPRTTEMRRPVMEREHISYVDRGPTTNTRVSWGAIIAGAVAAMAAQVLFATLGLAIGLSIPGGGEGMGIFAGVWWLVTGLISLFLGGWVAGRFMGIGRELNGSLHGVMTWALATTLSVLFVTTFGGVMAGSAVGAVADDIMPQQNQTLGQTQGSQFNQQQQPQAEMSPAATEQLADTATGAAWWTFFALLLGLLAAGAGGYLATPRDASDGFDERDSSRSMKTASATGS